MSGRHRRAATAVLVLLLAACGGQERPQPAVTDADGLLDWMLANGGRAGLSVVVDGAPVAALNADDRFPLASTAKVLTLVAYGEAVSAGRLDPAAPVRRADIERWYVPRSDGAAHERALRDWAERGVPADPPLRELAHAMIRWSDNAASDELLRRVGGPAATAAAAARFGMARQDAMRPIYGEFAAWAGEADAWLAMPPAARAERAVQLAEAGRLPGRPPPGDAQRRLAAVHVAGTPAEWSRLMCALAADAPAVVRSALERPDRGGRAGRRGAKNGSLAGVLTTAAYVEPPGGPRICLAVFLRDVPDRLDLRGPLDDFVASVADPRFRERVAELA